MQFRCLLRRDATQSDDRVIDGGAIHAHMRSRESIRQNRAEVSGEHEGRSVMHPLAEV